VKTSVNQAFGLPPVREGAWQIEMLYYNNMVQTDQAAMASHHHHHPAGHAHPPASVSPSILRLSAAERLATALLLIALIWVAVYWAMA
jgi:hypothetical protein